MNKNPLLRQLKNLFSPRPVIPVKTLASDATPVDAYWGRHTVNSSPFRTERKSLRYLEWRFKEYPLFRDLMGLWGEHGGQVLLDYGCGPGNDLTGFLVYSNAKKVIGIDVSEKALQLASQRLSLHRIDPQRVELIQISDAEPRIPLEDLSVDFIYCEGVLHHTSYPERILKEFRRILKPEGSASIMVYNRNSIWLHLYTAYEKMIIQNAFPGLSLEDAFTRNTDGPECPIARCYAPQEFIEICGGAGFRAEYKGGYLSKFEVDLLKKTGLRALEDPRLSDEHKDFLRALKYDPNGFPLYDEKYAGIGGVYHLT
jgi:SAM-dependent methyltransferase